MILPIPCPGLTPGASEIRRLAYDLPKRISVHAYKTDTLCVWIVFAGGTGTGKSTLFNAACGRPLSGTGVERPRTGGPIASASRECLSEKGFPLMSVRIEHKPHEEVLHGPATGAPGELLVLEHEGEDWGGVVMVDTPDLDSVRAENRRSAEDVGLLSDAIVFVSSQEKYSDEVPYRFLQAMAREGKEIFFVLNKAHGEWAKSDLAESFRVQGVMLPEDRIWFLPYFPAEPARRMARDPSCRDFVKALSETVSEGNRLKLRERQRSARAEDLKGRIDRLLELLGEEEQAARRWLERLAGLYENACEDLIMEEKERFASTSREYLRKEIRRLFARYDVLGGPRRVIKKALWAPLRMLGLRKTAAETTSEEALERIRERIDLTPVEAAVEKFNLAVLEELSPTEGNAALFEKMHRPEIRLTDEEIRSTVIEEQKRLAEWLEDTFKELSKDTPKSRKWGIYSTATLWGVLIVSFETAVGGGFTVLDAALDSVLAPFVTRGAVELFAYREIRRVAKELASRYQRALLSVLDEQRDRYEKCMASLLPSPEVLARLKRARREVSEWGHP